MLDRSGSVVFHLGVTPQLLFRADFDDNSACMGDRLWLRMYAMGWNHRHLDARVIVCALRYDSSSFTVRESGQNGCSRRCKPRLSQGSMVPTNETSSKTIARIDAC